ncbi:hypothetical protein KIN20_034215 [Parelaphostrongylus tenuis]|uniref:Uncharacterized protein n=1 Tax=Parelaphostrongylus tenuis TaxID=148309 RepID=A0AAD5R9Z3_PARTN|nr:hypothetical protein KIN20_034215 [Parelaphostrongylus tenuis]
MLGVVSSLHGRPHGKNFCSIYSLINIVALNPTQSPQIGAAVNPQGIPKTLVDDGFETAISGVMLSLNISHSADVAQCLEVFCVHTRSMVRPRAHGSPSHPSLRDRQLIQLGEGRGGPSGCDARRDAAGANPHLLTRPGSQQQNPHGTLKPGYP